VKTSAGGEGDHQQQPSRPWCEEGAVCCVDCIERTSMHVLGGWDADDSTRPAPCPWGGKDDRTECVLGRQIACL
jgi:hypothetical protein